MNEVINFSIEDKTIMSVSQQFKLQNDHRLNIGGKTGNICTVSMPKIVVGVIAVGSFAQPIDDNGALQVFVSGDNV